MNALFRLAGLSLLATFALVGCVSNDEPKLYDDDLSTLPQNRPQSWEGGGPMGSFMPPR